MRPFYSLQILFLISSLMMEGTGWIGLSCFLVGVALAILNLFIEIYDVLHAKSEGGGK